MDQSGSAAGLMMGTGLAIVVGVAALSMSGGISTHDVVENLNAADSKLFLEHVFGGFPGTSRTNARLLVRQGYVVSYDESSRIPEWVAYHIQPEFRDTPKRKGRFKSFRNDPDIENPVRDSEYIGLLDSLGFARGHLAPYGVMGGDRNSNGLNAAQGDPFDQKTVFQSNFMSNIAPQNHKEFNGSGGLWYKLERWIQDEVVSNDKTDVWIFAGCILGKNANTVGPKNDILVPAMFYKIVTRFDPDKDDEPTILAFLFPHQRLSHGEIQDFLVSVDIIEDLTGLDFFSEINDQFEAKLEEIDTFQNWDIFRAGQPPDAPPKSQLGAGQKPSTFEESITRAATFNKGNSKRLKLNVFDQQRAVENMVHEDNAKKRNISSIPIKSGY